MKQYRQHRQTNEQTWTTEYIAPVCNNIYNTDRQTIGHRQQIFLQLTHKYYIVRSNTIRLVPNVMSIFRHGYFAVIKLCTKRLKYKTTP